jgi:hypothetical protein
METTIFKWLCMYVYIYIHMAVYMSKLLINGAIYAMAVCLPEGIDVVYYWGQVLKDRVLHGRPR